MNRRCIAMLAGMVLCGSAPVQARKRDVNPAYVHAFPQTITVRAFLGEKISSFYLEDRSIGQSLRFLPNNSLHLGVGATIRGIGLNFSFLIPHHSTKDDLYGHTKSYDIQVHSYGPGLMLDAYVQQYAGFHLKNKDDVTVIPGPTEYPYFAEMRARAIGLSGLYAFNRDKYSLRSIVNQQDWQRKSAGSFLLGASVFYHLYSDANDIIPPYYRYPGFFNGGHPKEIEYYGLTANAGYGYTLVLDKASHYYLAAAGDVGLGPGYGSITDINGAELKHMTYCLSANFRFGAGYNSKRWFAGLYFLYHTDRYPLPYNQSALSTTQGMARLVVARRISTRKKVLARQPE